jgi:peroxiredoxin
MSPLDISHKVDALSLPALSGRPVSILRSNWTLVCFFKSDCPTSPLVVPYVERIHQVYGGASGFRVLGISQDDRLATWTFAAESSATFPILLDEGWSASTAFDLATVPDLFLIDETGRIIATQAGLDKAWLNDLSAQIARHLGRAPVEVAPADDGQPAYRPG